MGVMFFILKIITFPGAFLKGFLEQLACRMFGVAVEFSRYFQKNELCGHVEHLLAPHKGSFGICFLPHIISLFCGIAFSLPAACNMVYLGKFNLFGYIFAYLGLSCLLNCFPLVEDALNMWENLYGEKSEAKLVSKIFMAPSAAIMLAGAYLEKYFVSILTSVGFFCAIPYIIYLFI